MKMTTIETLFVQIFDRKNWIIEQVKQQKDSYEQNLASKLLVNGITPPSWLWNPNFNSHSSDPKDLKKEDLISKFLFPHPRPTIPYSSGQCSLYNKLVITGDNEELLDGLSYEIHASNKGLDTGVGLTTVPEFCVNDVGCTSNCAPEVNIGSITPHGHTDVGISSIHTAIGQSPTRIQTSRPVVTQNSGELSDGSLLEVQFSDKDPDAGNNPMTQSDCHDNDPESISNCVPQSSSQAQTDEGISKIHAALGQSPDGIQTSSPVVMQNHGELADGSLLDMQVSDKGPDAGNDLMTRPNCCNNGPECKSNCIPWSSPQDQTDIGISNIYTALGQLPVRIQTSSPFVTQNHEELSDGSLLEMQASDNGLNAENDLMTGPECRDNDTECISNCVPQSSPQDQTDVRISNIYTRADQSLARIHRSKSRQKALELRTSAKAAPKSCLVNENTASFSGVSMYGIDPQEPDHANELPKIAKSSDTNEGSFLARDAEGGDQCMENGTSSYCGRITRFRNTSKQTNSVNESLKVDGSYETARKDGDISKESCVMRQTTGVDQSKENGTSSYCGRITRSKSAGTRPVHVSESLNLCRSSGNVRKDGGTLAQSMEKSPHHVTGILEDVIHFNVTNKSSGVREAMTGNCRDKERICDGYFGRITRSRSSSRQPNSVNDALELDASSYILKVDCGTLGPSTDNFCEQLDEADEILEVVKPSTEHGVTQSRSGATEKYLLADTLNGFDGNALQHISGCKLIQTCPDANAMPNQEENVQSYVAMELGIEGPMEAQPLCLGSNMDPVNPVIGSEGLVVRSASDDHMFVKPMQLDFDNMEDCYSNGTFNPPSITIGPEKRVEEGHVCSERWDRSETVPCGLQQQYSGASLFPSLINQATGDSNNCSINEAGDLDCTEKTWPLKCSLPEMRYSSAKVESRPQVKRRKIEGRQTNCCTSASPSSRLQKLHNIQGGHISCYCKTVENNSDAVSMFQSFPFSHVGHVDESSDMIYQNMLGHIPVGSDSSPGLQIQEGELGFDEPTKVAEALSTFKHERLGPPHLVSSLTKQVASNSQGCSAHPIRDSLAARNMCDDQNYQQFLHAEFNDDVMTTTERILSERKSNLKEPGPLSPRNKDLASDETLPVFEGFGLEEQTWARGPDISDDQINFSELNQTITSAGHASILEQICRTASMHTPLSQFSYLSVPNGLLERADMGSTLPLSDDVGNHPRATSASALDPAFQRVLYSDCLPYPGARFGQNSKKSYSPPVRKFLERISSNSFSSEKRISFNPELTCFPIEEGPSGSEENENADEVDDKIQEDICSSVIDSGAKRMPLSEITEVCPIPLSSVSAADIFSHRGSIDSINPEVVPLIPNSVKQKLRNQCSNKKNKNLGKENQTLSVGPNSIKRATGSLYNSFSKAKLSGASVNRVGQRLSEKVKRNNIVSNVTSFIPLVQQKQAAAICTGKRDVRVRALEAAEAVKRLEEKREIERKMKKEALKLERAKIEQENMRQRELNKKKKEEGLRKKDADIAARKRLREEEERKEKEKKKRRIEGGRPHRAQEEKVHAAGKGEKEKPCSNMGKKMNSGVLTNNLERTGAESKTTAVNVQQPGTIPEDWDTFSDCSGSRKSLYMMDQSALRIEVATEISREKSYEVSPYQCSDDEEEEEDLPTKKFIPSWASKICVALAVSSQQKMDPNVIFPRESFCSADEVLVPRKG